MVENKRDEMERMNTGAILSIRDCRLQGFSTLEVELNIVDDRPMAEVAKKPTLAQMIVGIVDGVLRSPDFADAHKMSDPDGLAAAMGAEIQRRLAAAVARQKGEA